VCNFLGDTVSYQGGHVVLSYYSLLVAKQAENADESTFQHSD